MYRVVLLLVSCFIAIPAFTANAPIKLKYGSWGFDLAGADTSTRPGDDFFRYANGTWLNKTQIPPDKPAYSLRLAMSDLTEQRLKDILETAGAQPGDKSQADETTLSTLEEQAGAFYRSFMDESRVEQLGAKAIDPELTDLRNAKPAMILRL